MCGICGILRFKDERVPRSILEEMNSEIAHRGPDDEGYFISGSVGLAMRRLSIIDLATGHQPLSNEDGTVWIVYNGELYNYRELRERLIARGHTFKTNSDTEAIVHLYEEFSHDCVKQLRGMFAFAIWDTNRKRLFAARDRLGIKPFYYRLQSVAFEFGSEIKTLLRTSGHAALNRNVLPEYLAFGYCSGQETFFEGIHALPPSHTIEVDQSGHTEIRQYWDLRLNPQLLRPGANYVEEYRHRLEQCVSSHMMSDVPLGTFLSGGLDSSAVAAIASQMSTGRMHTFSVGYKESPFSELPFARIVSRHIGSQHHEVTIGVDDFFSALPALIWHEDKPITWPSSVALYFVARIAREHVKVVLTGEGSDETLAGYSRYAFTLWNLRLHAVYKLLTGPTQRSRVRNFVDNSNALSANLRRKVQHTFLGRDGESWQSIYFDTFLCAFSAPEVQDLLIDPVTEEDLYRNSLEAWKRSSGDTLSRMLYTDIRTYLVELLMKQDRMSMAASVESRVPFLDHELVEFALAIPLSLKIKGLVGKHILKAATKDLLPSSIIYRKKMGFPTPWRAWLNGPRFDWVELLLTEQRTISRGLFRPDSLQRLIAEHRDGKRDHTDRLWRLVNLELWSRVFVDREYANAPSEPLVNSSPS